MYQIRLLSSCLLSLLAVAFFTGCSASFDPSLSSPLAEASTVTLNASLYGGRQPIIGAHVYMYAADSTAYGHASDSLLLPHTAGNYPSIEDANGNYYVVTDGAGGFNLASGQYACAVGQEVYLYAIGGNPGLGTNAIASLLSVLGECGSNSSFPGVTFVTINEVSTVAAAYAISGYATDATHVSYPGTALSKIGITNAFANAGNLYNISVGGAAPATTTVGSGTVPQLLMNSLANSLAGCINSTGAGSPACGLLLSNANSTGASGGTAASDTATAAINMAHHPAYGVAAIINAGPSISAPYAPALGAAPSDLTLGISFTGGGLSAPKDIAIDGNGNVWVTNDVVGEVTKLSSLGVAASSTGYSVPNASFLAIDTSNDAWITSASGNAVYALTPSGSPLTGSPFTPSVTTGIIFTTTTALSSPQGIAADGSGNVWIASTGNSELFEISSAGVNNASSPYSISCMSGLDALAIDGAGDVWSASTSNIVCEAGVVYLFGFEKIASTTSGLSGAKRIAGDSAGDVWVTDGTSNSLTEYLSSTNQKGASPFTGGGLSNPYGLAIDGAGNAWVANKGNSSVSEFSSGGAAMSPASFGFTGGSQNGSQNLAVDGSGNVWITNTSGNSVTELVGAATPVVTPLVAGVAANTLGSRP